MKPGKAFEVAVLKGFKHRWPHAFAHRIIDNQAGGKPGQLGHGRLGNKSPADLIVVGNTWSYLIECKSTAGKSLPNNNMRDHQRHALADFDDLNIGIGMLAIEFRYKVIGYKIPKRRAWLLPFDRWAVYHGLHPSRKSLSMLHLIDDLDPMYEMDRAKIGSGYVWLPRLED